MSLASEAFELLYPGKQMDFEVNIKYSRKFKDYNANVKYTGDRRRITFNLSAKWKTIDKEIVIGLFQEFFIKLFNKNNEKKTTVNIDLYNSFIRNIHISAQKTKSNPVLASSFDRVNNKYFNGLIEAPNLLFSGDSIRRMATYEYQTDSIVFTNQLIDAPDDIIDYIMYHELLHKLLKFHNKNGRNYHHTHHFRKKEIEFENSLEIEQKLSKYLRQVQAKKKRFWPFY